MTRARCSGYRFLRPSGLVQTSCPTGLRKAEAGPSPAKRWDSGKSLFAFLLRRHFRTLFTGFRKPNRDGLLATLDFMARLTAFQFAFLVLVHGFLDRLLGFRT